MTGRKMTRGLISFIFLATLFACGVQDRGDIFGTKASLESTMIGSWDVKSYNNGFQGETGNITFFSNGKYSIIGTMSVAPGDCMLTGCGSDNGTWSVIDNTLFSMTANGTSAIAGRPYDTAYVNVSKWTASEMTLNRTFNTSIMTKVTLTNATP
jgi:hypothetical protein